MNLQTIKKIFRSVYVILILLIFSAPLVTSAAPLSADEQESLLKDTVWYSTTPVQCAPSAADIKLSASVNAENAYLYFLQRGLTPNQSAGLVGNLQAESGVVPATQERNPVGGGRGGYGIAQWTGGRRDKIEQFANNIEIGNGPEKAKYLATSTTGKVLDSLLFQLDYLWNQELEINYKSSVLTPLKLANSVQDASDIVVVHFETPLVIVNNIASQVQALKQYRGGLGAKILELYGNNSNTAAGILSTDIGCGGKGSVSEAFVGFPLKTTQKRMTELNGSCFRSPAMCQGGHPYVAYDIFADVGTPVVSILGGKVVSVSNDKCGGRLVSIFDSEKNVTVSYLHMSVSRTLVAEGDTISAGQDVGFVGTVANGCGSAHLHIDASAGDSRPGCKRESCPAANAAILAEGAAKISLGEQLYQTYIKLPQ